MMYQKQHASNSYTSQNSTPRPHKKISLCTEVHKIGYQIHPEKKRYPHRKQNRNKSHNLSLIGGFFFKNNVVFSDRKFFLEDSIDLVPTKNHPRPQHQQKETNNKSKNRWIKQDGNTQNETKSSKEDHR